MKLRELRDLSIILIAAIIFSMVSLSINFIDRLYNFFVTYTSLPAAKLFINLVFLYLAGLLLLLYRRWLEAAKKQAELENIIDSITPYMLVVADPDRKIVKCNASLKRMFGYETDEVINRKTDLLYSGMPSNPEYNSEILDILRREGFFVEYAEGKKKNGKTIPLEIITGKLRGRDGSVSLLRDITERKQAEAALGEAEEKFRNISAAAKDGIIMLDNDGNITYWNKAAEEIFGYIQEEVLGQEAHTILAHERYHEAFRKGFSIFKETGQGPVVGKTQELSALKKDGSEFTIELSISSVKIQGKWHSIGIARDITTRKLYEESLIETTEELKRLDQIKSDFISTASHELRTPLASIKNAVDLILSRKAGEITDTQEKFISMAARNINRLSALIDDLLDISRIESGKMQLNYNEVDIKNIIENVINTFRALADEKSLALKMNLAPALPPIYADAPKIEQVLINLVNNAIKFSPVRGTLSVDVHPVEGLADMSEGLEGFLELAVTDTGIGIPEEHVKHLFEKFYQVEPPLSVKRQPGTGLGLAISKGVVNALGGKIKCTSKEGAGSTFSFTLPIIATEKRFYYVLKNELAKARQYHLPLAVLIIKLEDFAHVKEVYGIKECERALALVKEKIEKKGLKFTDKINMARHNGKIIALLIMPDTSCSGAQAAQKRLMPCITGLEIAAGESKHICSFVSGVAAYPDDGSSAKELLDFAMERLEKNG